MNLSNLPPSQKEQGRVNQKLRDSAKDCPYCMGCGMLNPNGDRLCLAHSNLQADGKGRGLKARDDKGAILCAGCHDYVDFRGQYSNNRNRIMAQEYHHQAHLKTVEWWQKEGYL